MNISPQLHQRLKYLQNGSPFRVDSPEFPEGVQVFGESTDKDTYTNSTRTVMAHKLLT
jgi:hypothetical protein